MEYFQLHIGGRACNSALIIGGYSLERQIIEGQELLFDRYEDVEEKDSPSEDIAALHFQRIQAIPVLTDAEEADLLAALVPSSRTRRHGSR